MARSPKTFNDFIGQRRVVWHLTRLITGAQELGKPCPSLLLTAPNGFGKTSLACAIAEEYGSTLHMVFAGQDIWAADVGDILFKIKHGDIFFIDEAHSLRQDTQQALYSALDQNKVPALHGGRLDRTQFKSVASFTLILATNQPGSLKRGLRSRLAPLEFDPYSVLELKAIAERVALKEGVELTPQAARRLAEVAQGTPRHICRRLEASRLFWPSVQKLTQDHIETLLVSEGVDEHGLWPSQRLYLLTLAASPGGICSLERLSIKLGVDSAYIRQDIESYLIDQGLVEFHAGRGRVITAAGRALIADLSVWHCETETQEST